MQETLNISLYICILFYCLTCSSRCAFNALSPSKVTPRVRVYSHFQLIKYLKISSLFIISRYSSVSKVAY